MVVAEPSISLAPREPRSLFRDVLDRFVRHRLAVGGLVVLGALTALAILAPLVAGQDPNRVDLSITRQPPTPSHWLGGDLSGRDVLSRTLHGMRVSLVIGLGAVSLYVFIGTALGLMSGFFGGWIDQALMRLTDTVMSIPTLLLVIVFVSVSGPGLESVIVVIGLLGWPSTARLVRSQVLALREMEFITAARMIGAADSRILVRHLVPNTLPILTVVFTFGMAHAILLEAGLSFLGLGVRPPTPSLGVMINDARSPTVLQDLLWVWLPAAAAISLIVLAVNFIGDGLRDALDPQSAHRV